MSEIDKLKAIVESYNQDPVKFERDVIEAIKTGEVPKDNTLFPYYVLLDKVWSQTWTTDEFFRLSNPTVFTRDLDGDHLFLLTDELQERLGFVPGAQERAERFFFDKLFEDYRDEGRLSQFNNYVIAGGSVVDMLLNKIRSNSDCDIFFYTYSGEIDLSATIRSVERMFDLSYKSFTKKSINYKVKSHLNTLDEENKDKREEFYSTSRCRYQIIRSVYRSILQILLGFDLDCASVAFDGKNFWATKRFIKSWRTKSNLVDPGRYGGSYLYRMKKYQDRYGINPYVPSKELNPRYEAKKQELISMVDKMYKEHNVDNIDVAKKLGYRLDETKSIELVSYIIKNLCAPYFDVIFEPSFYDNIYYYSRKELFKDRSKYDEIDKDKGSFTFSKDNIPREMINKLRNLLFIANKLTDPEKQAYI